MDEACNFKCVNYQKQRNEEARLELFYVFVNFCLATGGG